MWRIYVDTGGTFTDAVGISPAGELRRAKVLSSGVLRARVTARPTPTSLAIAQNWGACDDLPRTWTARSAFAPGPAVAITGFDAAASLLRLAQPAPSSFAIGTIVELICPDEAPVLAARVLTSTPGHHDLPAIAMRLATTRGTNALLTRSFPPPAVVITRGLGDLLEIGTQQRPERDLFALAIRKPAPLHRCVIEADERLSADGSVLRPLDAAALERAARELFASGVTTAAVSLMHSDLNPRHELEVAAILRRIGFEVISLSHEVSPFVKLLPRATTTVIEAALAPIVSAYIARINQAVTSRGQGRLDVLTSGGGLVPAHAYRAKDSLLSGPAGGVLGAAAAAIAAGETEVLAFDVGGTSTDVSRWTRSEGIEHAFEHAAGDATLVSPAIRIHTVAAGGGSICEFDGAALTVGPASAGADPGPACYGRGGPLTLTDVQLLSGRIREQGFGVPLDRAAAETALAAILARVSSTAAGPATAERILDGLLDIAAERIAAAIQVVSSRRGHDPAQATLLAFGGAGGQIACLVAERLGITRVLVPSDAGLLSARGLMDAEFQAIAQRQVLARIDVLGDDLSTLLGELTRESSERLHIIAGAEPSKGASPDIRCDVALRWAGQETPVEIRLTSADADRIFDDFVTAYTRLYGYAPQRDRSQLEVVWLRVIASSRGTDAAQVGAPSVSPRTRSGATGEPQSMRSRGREHLSTTWRRSELTPGRRIDGPALIIEDHSTTVVDAGWSLNVGEDGALILTTDLSQAGRTAAPRLAAVDVELFTSRIEAAALAMGAALQRTSVSVNVKERLDYSCAVLDSRARLVACAPHVPVHLGSLGVCVREVLKRVAIGPGDVVVTNHPGCGGSHLPDVTVVAGAFHAPTVPIGYVAARAHHAEIGGIRPGSMPPGATRLSDEGVVIPPMYAVRGGCDAIAAVAELLATGGGRCIPSRAVQANLEDLAAAIAACRSGVLELERLAERHGDVLISSMMEAIQARSAAAALHTIRALGPVDLDLTDELDDGSPLRVRITAREDELLFDFTGSAPVHPGNLNATPAIVQSCLVYIMRVMVGRDLPLNEGLMRPVRLILPPGTLNPAFDPAADPSIQPAVVGGNVETSQRLVNLILRGLGLCAESQGTMNNLIFGDATRSYYETICGGAGAGPGFIGASAVHTHMTNTRITDPEILERRYPVRLERFAIRRGSGGAGQHPGGDGVERIIRFLAPMSVSVLTQRRTHGPRGLSNGADGTPGEQWIEHADGSRRTLAPSDATEARIGDAIVMRTPGGGGFGPSA